MKRLALRLLLTVSLFTFTLACAPDKEKKPAFTNIPYTVTKVFPHDTQAFTQGLVIYKGKLFESTGQDNSWIAVVDIATGKQNKKTALPKTYFGEGITILNDTVYQLTWQNHTGFVYDVNTFQKVREFTYPHEGWGITTDGKNLFVSDGTEKLFIWDPATLTPTDTLSVKEHGVTVTALNELEYIEGFIYANQWKTNYIFKINAQTGEVAGRLDLNDLAGKAGIANLQGDVLNGIAYDSKTKTILVTGKLWPYLFALKEVNR